MVMMATIPKSASADIRVIPGEKVTSPPFRHFGAFVAIKDEKA